MAATTSKTWADDVEEAEALPAPVTTEKDGITTIVEYKYNEEGKKVKVTRRIRRTLQTQLVNSAVAERKAWSKFGAERGKPAGPHTSTTTVGENMQFKLAVGKASAENEAKEAEDAKDKLKVKKIVCRLCKGDHFTSKCPYRETLEGINGTDTPDFGAEPTPAQAAEASTSGKYVPPSQRQGAQASGDSAYPGARGPGGGSRDDLPTLRVTNVSDDVEEDDLRDLFQRAIGPMHRIARVYIGKDRETGLHKGYAFVSFESREVGQRALEKVHGKGYANLILNVAWSAPRAERPGGA